MKIISYNKKGIKELLSKHSTSVFNVFEVNGTTQKIYKDVMFDLEKYHRVVRPFSYANIDQLEWLSAQQAYIKSTSLPNGVIITDNYPVGVCYPKYFFDYENFHYLITKSPQLVLANLRQAVEKNIELMERGIHNYDFVFNNILFKGDDVQLIDIDGKYVSSYPSYRRVYAYFLPEMIGLLYAIVNQQYDEKDAKKIINEFRERIEKINTKEIPIDYPCKILDELEKTQILRLK